jgi:glycosyltransferase involved in cell wall biosynthesis
MRYEHIQVARKVFTQARHVVFVSNKNYRTAERQISCRLANAGVVFNPLNIKNGDALPFPGKEKRSFACVARMDCSFKGQDILFQVLGDKQWKDRDWELNLYGAGPDEAYLKDLAALYGLSDRIHFRGHVDDIEKVWVVNHIQLMPSISEGTPLALVEAMLCGRPAVVTDVGGNAEMITEGVTGFIAEAASPCSFGKAMEKAWLHAGDWEEYGINAHQYVKKNVDFQPWQTLLGLLTREN